MVLNINSEFDIEAARQRPVHIDLSDPSSPEEVETALGALKNGKSEAKTTQLQNWRREWVLSMT